MTLSGCSWSRVALVCGQRQLTWDKQAATDMEELKLAPQVELCRLQGTWARPSRWALIPQLCSSCFMLSVSLQAAKPGRLLAPQQFRATDTMARGPRSNYMGRVLHDPQFQALQPLPQVWY